MLAESRDGCKPLRLYSLNMWDLMRDLGVARLTVSENEGVVVLSVSKLKDLERDG